MALKKKQLIAEGKLDKHGRPNDATPKEYLRALPDVTAAAPARAGDDDRARDATAPTEPAEAGENGKDTPHGEKKVNQAGVT